MKVLFFGDIVAKQGRAIVLSLLDELKDKYKPDLVIANGENSAHGKGITYKIYNQLRDAGIDVITMGNHTFSKSDIFDNLELMDRLVCPRNHIKRVDECLDYVIVNVNKIRVCITSIQCEAMMLETSASPFETMDYILNKTKKKADMYIVDLHGEATAEKRIFAEYYKDKLVAVLGTHTHVQTADERIISNLAFISDVGMCGAYDSIIGRDIKECIDARVNKLQTRYTVADNKALLCAVLIDIDDKTLKAKSIERIQIRPY